MRALYKITACLPLKNQITIKVNKPQQNTSRSKTVWHQMVLVNNIMLMSWQFKKQGHTANVNKFEENALTYLNEQSKLNLVLKNKKHIKGK